MKRCIALAAAVLIIALSGCIPSDDYGRALVNRDRTDNGLRPLTTNSVIQRKAQAWAEIIAAEDRGWRHSDVFSGQPACARHLGENVGDGTSLEGLEKAYMASPTHRENVLAPYFTEVGIGVAKSPTGRVYSVQEFISGCHP